MSYDQADDALRRHGGEDAATIAANAAKAADRRVLRYQRVARTDDGFWVLMDILDSLWTWRYDLTDPADVAVHNKGLELLARMGVLVPGNQDKILQALLDVGATRGSAEEEQKERRAKHFGPRPGGPGA